MLATRAFLGVSWVGEGGGGGCGGWGGGGGYYSFVCEIFGNGAYFLEQAK